MDLVACQIGIVDIGYIYKLQVDKGSEFCNRSIKSWLERNATETYSIHNEGKIAVTERFIRTLNNKIYKYLTSI